MDQLLVDNILVWGRRQAAAHAGSRNALAGVEAVTPVILRWPPMGPARSGRPDDKLRALEGCRSIRPGRCPSRLASLAPQGDGRSYSAAMRTSGAAARTSASTCSSN